MKERESNIEAARILAMILVVLVHANYARRDDATATFVKH